MNVPCVNLAAGYEELRPEIDSAIARVMASGHYILGPEVEAFEQEFAEYVGCKYAVGVDSGSSALELSLLALGIGAGDEVITVSHTFIATASAIVAVGARPMLVDIDPVTYTMDPKHVSREVSARTRAIIPVHLYGQSADMSPIMEIAQRNRLAVIEDACEAHGAYYDGRAVGSIGGMGCFSFYPTKNLGGYGDGGMITTNDEEDRDELRLLRNYGQAQKYLHVTVSRNRRLDELQGAILRVKLKRLTEWNASRRTRALRYRDSLEETQCVLPRTDFPTRTHVFHVYAVLHPKRDELQKFLAEKGVETVVHYPVPIHRQSWFAKGLVWNGVLYPVTERVASTVLSLPMYPHLPCEHVEYVAKCIKEFERGQG